MRSSDWSSDVCSSDLGLLGRLELEAFDIVVALEEQLGVFAPFFACGLGLANVDRAFGNVDVGELLVQLRLLKRVGLFGRQTLRINYVILAVHPALNLHGVLQQVVGLLIAVPADLQTGRASWRERGCRSG